MTTAVVVGATGLIGQALVALLANAPHIDKVENHVIDFDDIEQSREFFNADILFSCLGTTKKQAGSIDAQRKVDLDYQYKVAQIAYQQGVSRYFLVSSSGANAGSSNPYLKMKGELEDKVKTLEFEQTCILKPSLLLGQREVARPGEQILGKLLPIIGLIPYLRRYRPIKGEQVAKKMCELSAQASTGYSEYVLEALFDN